MNVETHSCFPATVVIAVSSCPSGWTLTYDNPGTGYSQPTVASCDECYSSCANDATCLNFECSPTGLLCYLYAVQGPVTGSMLSDYFQCDKPCACISLLWPSYLLTWHGDIASCLRLLLCAYKACAAEAALSFQAVAWAVAHCVINSRHHHHHHHHQKAFRNKSHTSHGQRPGL